MSTGRWIETCICKWLLGLIIFSIIADIIFVYLYILRIGSSLIELYSEVVVNNYSE